MSTTRRERARFRDRLARLKRRGCNLLVVGEASPATRRAASRRLFGDPEADRDRVLLAVGATDPERWLPTEGRVVEVDVDTRSAAGTVAGEARSAVDEPRPSHAPGPDASTVTPVPAVVDEVSPEASADAAEPGRFRLGITALAPLLATDGGPSPVPALRRTVRDARGIGHYHLPAPADAARVREVAADFDATLELREGPDGPQERWRVATDDLVTPWMPLRE